MRRKVKKRIWFAILLLISLFWFAGMAVETDLKMRIPALVQKNCPSCKLEIGELHLGFLNATVNLTDVRFSAGDPEATAVRSKAQRVTAHIAIRPLFKKIFWLSSVVVEEPNVLVIEGDEKLGPSAPSQSHLKFGIQNLSIQGGEFAYSRVHGGKEAVIKVHEIEGQIRDFGNAPDFERTTAQGAVSAVLEKSGRVRLLVNSEVFSTPTRVAIDMELHGQNLADINRFFMPAEGLRVQGRLIHGVAHVDLRGARLWSWVKATYQDLQLKVFPTDERSHITAFFQNLLQSTQLISSHDVRKVSRPEQVEITREEETFLQFILRGLRDAALQVVSTP